MNKFTSVAVIAALSIATQALAMGGGSRGGQTMSSPMSTTTMNTGTKMTTGTHTMTSTATMSGAGAMTTTMPANGTTKPPMTPGTPMQPVAAK
jgi:hypothetical protein